MANELAKSLNDFSFGMLFMSLVMFTALMYHKGRSHRLQRMMCGFMAYLLGITTIELLYFYLAPGAESTLTSWLTDIVEMTVVPWALLIIKRLTHPKTKLRLTALANALLYGAGLAAFALTGSEYVYKGLLLFTQLYSVFIIVYGFVAVRKFNKLLADNFSDNDLSLYWLKYILCLYVGIIAVWSFATVAASEYCVAIYNVSVIPAFGLFCYFVYRQEDMLEALETTGLACNEEDVQPTPDEEEENSAPPAATNYHFADNLERVFSEKEIFLNPTLNINDLAHELGTNRTYISNYLNQQLHTTFYEYVNHWRVARAKDLLAQTSLPLDAVAAKSGFNSQSSFRRYFAAAVGTTPSAYRKQQRK